MATRGTANGWISGCAVGITTDVVSAGYVVASAIAVNRRTHRHALVDAQVLECQLRYLRFDGVRLLGTYAVKAGQVGRGRLGACGVLNIAEGSPVGVQGRRNHTSSCAAYGHPVAETHNAGSLHGAASVTFRARSREQGGKLTCKRTCKGGGGNLQVPN